MFIKTFQGCTFELKNRNWKILFDVILKKNKITGMQ